MRQVILTGPRPPAGYLFCVPCAMAWKDRAEREMAAEIREARGGPDDAGPYTLRLGTRDNREPEVAVARCICPGLEPLGVIDLGWDCLRRVEFRQAAVPPADGAGPVPLLVPGRR